MKDISYNAYSNAKEQFNVRLLTLKQEVENAFGDLVNNYSLFHEKYSSTDFLNSMLIISGFYMTLMIKLFTYTFYVYYERY